MTCEEVIKRVRAEALQQQAKTHCTQCNKLLEKEKLEDLKAQREADDVEEELARATSKYLIVKAVERE